MNGDRITHFANKVQQIPGGTVAKMPPLDDKVRHDGECTRINTHLGANYVVFNNSFENCIPQRYNLYRLRAIGRDNSRHKVHFGALAVNECGTQRRLDVAVKDSHVSLALGEIAMMQYFEKLGLPTFDLVGMVVNPGIQSDIQEQLTHIVTKFDPEVVTMDTLDWLGMNDRETQEQLALASIALAGLGGRAIRHGDSELKNFGQTDDGTTFLIDLELASSFRDIIKIANNPKVFGELAANAAQERIYSYISEDLRDLKRSIYPYLIKKGKKQGAIFKTIDRSILEPYRAGLVDQEHEKIVGRSLDVAYSVFKTESVQ